MPTYPGGIIGFTFLSKATDPYKFNIDFNRIPKDLKYYTPEIHKASFVLPKFAKDAWGL